MRKYLLLIAMIAWICDAYSQPDPPYPPAPAAAQNIVAAEYFVDTDPGAGNGIAILVSAATDITNLAVTVNINGLSNGIHRVYIRTRSAAGIWSITNFKDFLYDYDFPYPLPPALPQNIVAAEYFIDTDPGTGNATAITITPGVDLVNIAVPVNVSGLPNGVHRLYLRTKNTEGRWSLTNVKDFIVDFDPAYPAPPSTLQNIVAAEYFIDTDPGTGNATAISITPGTDISNIALSANVAGLSVGVHRIYLRTKSAEGRWSLTNVKDFIVDLDPVYPTASAAPQNIVAAEYFVDTDPGAGNATAISITPGTDINGISFNVNTGALATGEHRVYLRTKGAEGKWSITNVRLFNMGTLTVLPDSIVFANTIVNTSPTKDLVVRNNSSAVQTISALFVGAPFGSDFTTARNIPAGQTDTIRVSFTPTVPGNFTDTIILQTSAGDYPVPVRGTGVASISSWVLEPATGYNYGNVQTGAGSNYTFTIRNTGNIPVTLSQVTTSDAAFIPTYTGGTIIAAGATLNLPVAFQPVTTGTYNAILKIKATAGGPDSVTTVVSGTGFTPATPPVLSFVTTAPYDGVRGVNPAAGQTGTYTYKIIYRSAENRAPAAGYPKAGIDFNGDQDFDDAGEGMFAMSPENSSTDYITGVVYTYTVNFTNYTDNAGYRFFAQDALGNTASTVNTGYYSGPIVTYQTLDLRLFANDISFSKTNPLPGETFTVTANITNNSAFNAVNVPIYFYRDTILIGSTTLAAANAFSSAIVTRTLSFGADGFYPIKVWIDPFNTLSENNVLNNYAIRPVIVGNPVLPGGITVTANATVQNCPAQKIIFTGHADYFGTSLPSVVAGAAVTINTGTALVQGTTDAAGNFTIIMENPPCGSNNLLYTVSVTDFTFTSSLFTGSVNVPCLSPNFCIPPNTTTPTSAAISVPATPCAIVSGSSSTINVTIKYRGRNPANQWGLWDKIWKDTVKVFSDGVLIQTFATPDIPNFGSAGTFPGDEKIIPVSIPFGTPGPHVITVEATYVYNEFFQNEDNFYHGVFIPMTATASTTAIAAPSQPDLTLGNFQQPVYRTLTFEDRNIECTSAGSHIVRVLDVTNPASPFLVSSTTVPLVAAKSHVPVTVSLAGLSTGVHVLRVITDTTELISETNEDNNIFLVTLEIPDPDLSVSKVVISPTNLSVGSAVMFNATINNTGIEAGAFTVRFLANGVPIGSDIPVTGIAERGIVSVTSPPFTVPTTDAACPLNITVVADAGSVITEKSESNNSFTFPLGSDINPAQLPIDYGSSANPARVRVNTSKLFNVHIRNTGTRNISQVTVKFMHNGTKIGEALIPVIVAGEDFPAVASFTHTFTTAGPTTVDVITDTANLVCEISETNNTASYHVNVTDSKEDYVVLSQYISPSSLNPNAAQNITIVGTVKNIGNRIAPASTMRFYVDDIQLGNDVPFNSLEIGQDTTVAATATYSSLIPGVKVIKIVVDEADTVDEEDENNNEATRTIIVGDAPDMTRNIQQPISFNPNGFNAGDSVMVSYQVKNAGSNYGTARVRLKVFDANGTLTALDSVQFSLIAGANTTLARRMFFSIDSGYVVAEIVDCSPMESNLLNNTDTLYFSHMAKMKTNLVVSNLDMKAGLPQELPGWIGGKIELGDYNLTVLGTILNADTAHFIITNGNGKLKIVNSNATNIFPVGTSQYSSNFARINNSGTQDNFSVRVVPYVLTLGDAGNVITNGFVNRTWFIEEEVAGGSNASVQMFWFEPHELPGFDRSISKAAHFVSGWQLGTTGPAQTDSIDGRYNQTQTGYTNFSPFSVTSHTNASLPLQFISFTANPAGENVELTWITDNEVNTSHFVIQFSNDGITFNGIGNVNAANTPGMHRYTFTHLSPGTGKLYYRIKQVDIDGRFDYSKTVWVNRNTGAIAVTVYPNPAVERLYIRFGDRPFTGVVQLFNQAGQLVFNKPVNAQLTMEADVKHLAAGLYSLVIISPQEKTLKQVRIR